MRVVSQNGWPVLNEDGTTVITAGGRRWRVAKGQVATVFKAFIARYAREVERIDAGQLDDWSWAVRNVRGSTTSISNHASGTAVDVNALAHARGAEATFTREELLALHRLLDDFPVIRWGGFFSTTVDEMHFEISCTPAQLDTWQRTGIRPPSTAGGLLRPADPEDDDVVTTADIQAIADAVWAKALDDPRGRFSAGARLASLDYTQQAMVMPTLGDMPAAAAEAVWDGTRVDVRHPQSSAEQNIPMGTALGRAASVIWDGRQAGVLHQYAHAEVATLAQTDDPGLGAADVAALQQALAGIGTQLDGIYGAVDALAAAVLEPAPTALSGSAEQLTLPDVARQNHARAVQLVALVAGIREALDTLAVATVRGNIPEAEKLQDAILTAMRLGAPRVSAPRPLETSGR